MPTLGKFGVTRGDEKFRGVEETTKGGSGLIDSHTRVHRSLQPADFSCVLSSLYLSCNLWRVCIFHRIECTKIGNSGELNLDFDLKLSYLLFILSKKNGKAKCLVNLALIVVENRIGFWILNKNSYLIHSLFTTIILIVIILISM